MMLVREQWLSEQSTGSQDPLLLDLMYAAVSLCLFPLPATYSVTSFESA
jgi:hypothetical protein